MHTIHADADPLSTAAAALNAALKYDADKQILLLLSGGSAIAIANLVSEKLLGPHVTVTTLDERYSYKQDESNMGTLHSMPFWDIVLRTKTHSIDTQPKDKETLHEAADRYDASIKNWHTEHPDGIVIATLGIGPDGHISGVLPYPEDPAYFARQFLDTDRAVTGYSTSPDKNPFTERMTTTLSYLRTYVAHAIVYVGDEKKEPALRAALTKEGSLPRTPARILREMPNVHIIVPNTINTLGSF